MGFKTNAGCAMNIKQSIQSSISDCFALNLRDSIYYFLLKLTIFDRKIKFKLFNITFRSDRLSSSLSLTKIQAVVCEYLITFLAS